MKQQLFSGRCFRGSQSEGGTLLEPPNETSELQTCFLEGVMKFSHFGDIKHCKSMVNLRDFSRKKVVHEGWVGNSS